MASIKIFFTMMLLSSLNAIIINFYSKYFGGFVCCIFVINFEHCTCDSGIIQNYKFSIFYFIKIFYNCIHKHTFHILLYHNQDHNYI